MGTLSLQLMCEVNDSTYWALHPALWDKICFQQAAELVAIQLFAQSQQRQQLRQFMQEIGASYRRPQGQAFFDISRVQRPADRGVWYPQTPPND